MGPFGRLYFKSRRNRSNSPSEAKSGSITRFISSKDLNQEAVRNDSNARRGANGPAADMSGTGFTLKEMTAEANAVPGERSVYYKDVVLIRESVTEVEKEYFDGHKDDILRMRHPNYCEILCPA